MVWYGMVWYGMVCTVRSSCAYVYVTVFTNENGGSISTRQSTVSIAILLHIEGN